MATVELTRVTHRYAATDGPALRAVTLSLGAGLTAVAGPSGGGKSTLLRLLNGLVPHFHGGHVEGRAVVCGLDVARTPTRRLARHVGFVFQDCEAQMLGGTVEREVAFGPENLGVPRALMHELVDEALARTGTGPLRRRAVRTLSGGERQRVAIASALAMRPEVLALDEPLAQLDAEGARAVAALCVRLAANGTAVVLAEHRLDLVLPAADMLVLVDGGVDGPAAPGLLARRLAAPPQAVAVGVAAGWDPVPLDAASLRGRLDGVLRALPLPPTASGEEAWRLEGVTAGPGAEAVLEDVDLAGGTGEVVALVGANGAGKTTLLRALAGLLPPLAGTVVRRPGRVAYLPQDPAAALCRETVGDEVALTLRRTGSAEPSVRVLADLGLCALTARDPRDLSAGERQRVAVAAMLCGGPAIALLDEPTRGMDAAARAALVRLVRRLAAEGSAVVVATHDTELAAEVADRVVEVADRGVRQLGPPRLALSGASPYATQVGALLATGPVTAAEAVALVRDATRDAAPQTVAPSLGAGVAAADAP